MSTDAVIAEVNKYRAYGACLEVFSRKEPEVLVAGPAGTGKSRAILEKLNVAAWNHPGARLLMVRKTRESLTESALVTFENKVLPLAVNLKGGPQRNYRQVYRYPNGSQIVVGGLDKASKIMSTEYDMAYIQEATEVEENDWEMITTRLRNGVMPYHQILADCNPGPPSHWLKKRCDTGRCVMLESRHDDNPTLYDHSINEWTENGLTYLSKLDSLSGVRKQRLRYGIWAAAEGMVYEADWNPAIHLKDRFEIPADWPRYWVIDFGYTNPFVWQAWAEDPDGRLYRYKEIYHTQRLVEDHARQILQVTEGEPRPRAIICDHDAEGRATLVRHLGMQTTAALKTVREGIQAVAARLKPVEDGRPRVIFLRDSLVERDPQLVELKRPDRTEEEFESYIWDTSSSRAKGEEPVKRDDHGMDALRYMVMYADQPKRILTVY